MEVRVNVKGTLHWEPLHVKGKTKPWEIVKREPVRESEVEIARCIKPDRGVNNLFITEEEERGDWGMCSGEYMQGMCDPTGKHICGVRAGSEGQT